MPQEFHEKDSIRNEPVPEKDPTLELPEIPAPVSSSEPVPPAEVQESEPAQPPHRRSGWKVFAAAVALMAVGAGVGSATTFGLTRKYMSQQPPIGFTEIKSPGAKVVAQGPMEAGTSVIPGVYRRISPSVVKINVQGGRGVNRTQGSGSGFVVDPRGFILTNHHVVAGASAIQVKFVDGTVMEATVVGGDRYSDLAVLKVNPGNRSLVAAPLGDSDGVEVGELAIAIGTPFGQEFTVTAGIVSALNRDIIEEDNPFEIPGAIQTDAAINPGNSGGPLLNALGEVIGINTAIESPLRGSVGIGFAIPANLAKKILPTLIAGEQVQYPWLGVSLGTLDEATAKRLGSGVKEGVVVAEIVPQSPAERSGLKDPTVTQRGQVASADIIVEIDGKAMKTSGQLVDYLKTRNVGDLVTLTVVRGKERITLTATLGARPQDLGREGE